MTTDVQALVSRYNAMVSDRLPAESVWQETAERVLPRAADFNIQMEPNTRRDRKVYDSTAIIANERFASIVESLLTPRASKWHMVKASIPELNRIRDVQIYYDQINLVLFDRRYAPPANFGSQSYESYLGLGCFGTAGLFIKDDAALRGPSYRSIHLGDLYIDENDNGIVDTVFRRLRLTARQIRQSWPDKLPRSVKQALDNNKPDEKFTVIHACMPNKDYDLYGIPPENMRFSGIYFSPQDDGHIYEEGGYYSFPYAVSRYVTGPREKYGRSPATESLGDIKMINEMSRTTIRSAQKSADPPLLVADDGVTLPININPGQPTFARMEGRTLAPIQPLETGARVNIAIEMENQRRAAINQAFLIDVFSALLENPNMTATQVLQVAQQRGVLVGPIVGRQQSEFAGPLLARELDVLARSGMLPPPPPVLIEAAQDGGLDYTVEYVSPLSRAMRSEEAVGIMRTLETTQAIAAFDPSVLDNFDGDEILRTIADVNGMPARTLRDPRQVEAIREQRRQQENAMLATKAAPVVADAAVKGSQAMETLQRIGQSSGALPTAQPPGGAKAA